MVDAHRILDFIKDIGFCDHILPSLFISDVFSSLIKTLYLFAIIFVWQMKHCADVPLRNCSLSHSLIMTCQNAITVCRS